jgi:hypothetical protein
MFLMGSFIQKFFHKLKKPFQRLNKAARQMLIILHIQFNRLPPLSSPAGILNTDGWAIRFSGNRKSPLPGEHPDVWTTRAVAAGT